MKKTYIWILSILVLVGFIFAYWSISNRAFSAENALEATYQRGFYNLLDQVNDLNLLISKSEVTSSDEQRIMLFTTIWHQAEGARSSLSSMPLGNRDITNLQKFFAQLGDFSYYMANKGVNKDDISEDDWIKLDVFRKNTQELSSELRKVQKEVVTGKIKWEERKNRLAVTKKMPQGLASSFESFDQKLKKEAPTITYDGPFSDHVEKIKPRGLTGKSVTAKEAREVAKDLVSKVSKGNYEVRQAGRVKGNIPGYSFEVMESGGKTPSIVLDVSETGGHVVWFMNTRSIENARIDIKAAVVKANEFLETMGYTMEPTGSLREGNTVHITFVPRQKEVLLYPDFIKVEVALDDGQIVGMDAVGFLTNHTTRDLTEFKFAKEDIHKKLNPKLEVKRIRKVLIPSLALKELFCYEVDAKLNNDRFLIYLNAENGREERILKVVETDKGTMTM